MIFYNYCHMNIHMYMYIYVHVHITYCVQLALRICMCVQGWSLSTGQPLWELIPERDWLFLSQQALLACSSLSKAGTMWSCSCLDRHVNWCCHYGCLVYISRVLTTDALVLWLLQPFFCSSMIFPTASAVGSCISWGWLPHSHLFSVVWPGVNLCNHIHLL